MQVEAISIAGRYTYGRQVQIRPEYEFIDTGERPGTNGSAPCSTIEEQAPLFNK
ncbi:Uncharacterized protein ALO89_01955 [Pseudomonas coronafaciens pv. porri]|nr:Uncharacterized protein ALO89_01955 [Pseudomonas coronafaciens pv. porri]RMW04856.1 hypothetical protein ALP00_02480 [Pseudomonas coronafaciens pv. porri]